MKYRPNVALILQKSDGRILVCERSDFPGSWQFPQGGVKMGESRRQALAREVREELGLRPGDYKVIAEHGPYRYLFFARARRRGFDGQEQTYFLAQSNTDDPPIDLGSREPEFLAFQWILPAEFNLLWLPDMKQPVYKKVFQDALGVHLP